MVLPLFPPTFLVPTIVVSPCLFFLAPPLCGTQYCIDLSLFKTRCKYLVVDRNLKPGPVRIFISGLSWNVREGIMRVFFA